MSRKAPARPPRINVPPIPQIPPPPPPDRNQNWGASPSVTSPTSPIYPTTPTPPIPRPRVERRALPPTPPPDDPTPSPKTPLSAGHASSSLLRDAPFKAGTRAQTDSTYMSLLTDINAIEFVEMVHVVRSFDGTYERVGHEEGLFDEQLLSVQRGDIMLVLERMDENFLRAKRFKDGETGIVHKNNVFVDNGAESMSWFHGPLDAPSAASILKNPDVIDGSFLIRNSSKDASSYSLTIRSCENSRGVLHYHINNTPEGFTLFPGKTFTHLFQLVAFYQFPGCVHTCKLKQHLTVPVERRGPLPLREIPASEIEFGGPLVDRKNNVIAGTWKGCALAIKTWQPTKGSIQDFEEFGNQLLEVQHLNVVKFIGVCTYPPNKYIVFEMVNEGSLENLLKKSDINSVQLKVLLKIAQGISNGMAFLETKGIIHRNLKASNVVINKLDVNNRTVRIIGFTKARKADDDNGQCTFDGCTFAVRWSAPEIINKIIGGSHKTDVWSFAVTMTEIFSGGQRPYDTMDNVAVKEQVQSDYRMDRPVRLDNTIWRGLILPSWSKNPMRRPSFSRIQDFFDDYLGREDEGDYDQLVDHYTL